jgi:hypothetical protein
MKQKLTDSINHLIDAQTGVAKDAVEVFIKLNFIPNMLGIGVILSQDIVAILRNNLVIQFLYYSSITTFFIVLILFAIYSVIHRIIYDSRIKKSINLLNQDCNNNTEIDEFIIGNNQFPDCLNWLKCTQFVFIAIAYNV